MQDIYEDPNRLKRPVKKTQKGWVEISWDDAFDEIQHNLNQIITKHGNDSVAMYLGNPTVHNYGALLFHTSLTRALKSRNLYSATSVDQLPHHFASNFMFGHSLLIPIPDIDRTRHLLIMGANPVVSNGSMMSAAGMPKRLKIIQTHGGKVIVIDPRLTETAQLADEHHFIKPGTDVFLLLAMLNVIFENQLVTLGNNELHTNGLEQLRDAVTNYRPEEVSERTGLSASSIEQLALDFASAEKAVCYGRMGLSTQEHGGLCQWLINALNIVTGNFDSEGGAMFTSPAVNLLGKHSSMHKHGRWKSRVRGLPEFKGELPVSVMAEEMLTPGEGQVRALISHAGNPVLSTPNGTRLEQALSGLDYMVSIDIYINETSRHANIILPPATGLETDHYDLIFNTFAVKNTAKFSPALFKAETGTRYDWQIFKELARRISGKSSLLDRFSTPTRLLDLALRFGPYGSFRKPLNFFSGLKLKKLRQAKHGLDLGPLKSQVPAILRTADKKINLTPEIFLKRLEQITKQTGSYETAPESEQFMLIGRRHLRSNNTWMHNSYRLIKGKNRCTLMMNNDDAARFEFSNHQDVCVSSATGRITLPVEITDQIMPGVVSIPHGYGHSRKDTHTPIAESHAGVSINDITDEQQIDELTGNAAFSGQRVWLEALPV